MYGIINKTIAQNVKITMIDTLLSHLAPHPCYSCGKLGSILCDYCKYDIVSGDFIGCIVCGGLVCLDGVCSTCASVLSKAWCVGDRTDVLRKIIDDYKFERTYEAHKILAALLAARLPILPSDCVIVPIPTISSHIRQRGYDHTLLIAKELARLKDIQVTSLLTRKTNSIQRGQTRKERFRQAKTAFLAAKPAKDKTILLLDDIVTTGATLQAAATALRENGAKEVWAAVVARQPIDS